MIIFKEYTQVFFKLTFLKDLSQNINMSLIDFKRKIIDQLSKIGRISFKNINEKC